MRAKPKGAKSGLFEKFVQMLVEQAISTHEGASEAKDRRRIQERQEQNKQREINAARPHSPDEEVGDSRDMGEQKIVRCMYVYKVNNNIPENKQTNVSVRQIKWLMR